MNLKKKKITTPRTTKELTVSDTVTDLLSIIIMMRKQQRASKNPSNPTSRIYINQPKTLTKSN